MAPNGTHLIILSTSRQMTTAAHIVVANAMSALEADHRDMNVLYVGQGIGKVHTRTAVDRLLNHTTLQRILAETSTNSPELEVSILLYRFEHGRTMISNGGDLNAEPIASDQDETAHFERLRNVRLNRDEVVTLAEAALINHFKPHYNTLLKSTNFAANHKIKPLKKLLAKGITGLTVEICTSTLNARLGTRDALPMELSTFMPADVLEGCNLDSEQEKQAWAEELRVMAHTHYASFPSPHPRSAIPLCTAWCGSGKQTANTSGHCPARVPSPLPPHDGYGVASGLATPSGSRQDHVVRAAMASTSTNAPGNGNATTCNAVRAGLFGCSGVPKNCV